ncbi:MAG: MarR family transcriptional regulator [Nitrospirae bacterium GWD2_57_9]|nr:MAG: MarR family transcriptional regulator [Nitrospirae bacterium GWD2_57_9]OGW48695.1 MAG: MarR family transcriptional regulator [Nitrospirae bacterium GWC2_57_9]
MIRNSYKGSREEAAALNAYVKLMRAAESVSSAIHGHLSQAGLTVSQFGVLEALYHLGPLSQAELARKILKSTGNITMVIDNLEKRGLVKRERDTQDRRYYSVGLTADGKKVIAGIFPKHAGKIVKGMNVLSRTEQATLGDLCRKLGMGVKQDKKGADDE